MRTKSLTIVLILVLMRLVYSRSQALGDDEEYHAVVQRYPNIDILI